LNRYIDKHGNEIEAELFKEGMEDGWKLLVGGGYGSKWKKFKTKKSAENFIAKNKGAEYLTKMGDHYFDANNIKYYLYIGFGEYVIDDFEEHYVINSSNGKILESKSKFEKTYKHTK
jgi:hypothetical protein